MVRSAAQKAASWASVAGLCPMTRTELSPRPTATSSRPSPIWTSLAKMLAATDQSRTRGFVTSGPTRSVRVWSRQTAIWV